MINMIVFEDEEVDKISNAFFTKKNAHRYIEEFNNMFALFDTYSVEQILGVEDGDVRLSFDQFCIIWENYKVISYKFGKEYCANKFGV